MRVKHLWPALKELTGTDNTEVNYLALTMGLEWLANEQLFDPMIGYLDFTVDDGYTIALPRDVKTPLRLNINNNPSFSRDRLFEFSANTDGSVDGESIGWTWDNRGYCVVQDERKLPARLKYVCTNASDNGAICKITYYDLDGQKHVESLIGNTTGAALTDFVVGLVDTVIRDVTTQDCYLKTDEDLTVARYAGDEDQPEYRVIKLSKTGIAVRMMFRRHIFEITSQEDVIPFHSKEAIIQAAKAVRFRQKENYEAATIAEGVAKKLAANEQASRKEADTISQATELQTVRNANINTLDSLIVADVYDEAARIFGPIGRGSLFDKITTAREVLSKKTQWDSTCGVVDIFRGDNTEVNAFGDPGNGYFVLPRYVGTVLQVNINGWRTFPRNSWFEFHLNGDGESNRSALGTWDEAGWVPIHNDIPLDATTRLPIAQFLACSADNSLDDGLSLTVEGFYADSDGAERAITISVPIKFNLFERNEDAIGITRITRVVKPVTRGFITLKTVTSSNVATRQLGFYYPDEIEPMYRRIKIQTAKATRIRLKYKLKTLRISGLNDLLHLRSSISIVEMLRSLKSREDGNVQVADAQELSAKRFLEEHEYGENPTDTVRIQVVKQITPGGFGNIR